jgi:hypothetical protein
MRLTDLTGRRFNLLTVLKRDTSRKGVYWLCSCACGKTASIASSNLNQRKNGRFRQGSCGCEKYRLRIRPHKYVMFDYLASAKSKGILFELTEDVFSKLITSSCDYCGRQPERTLSPSRMRKNVTHAAFRWNGIDRIDSGGGYVEGNVVPCCKPCNELKSDKNREEFLRLIEDIYRWQNRQRAASA